MQPEKGAILDRFLVESLDRHIATTTTTSDQQQQQQPFTLVEVGTYCGYSTIRIAHTILQWQQQQQQQQQQQPLDFHIFTVDINPQTVSIARQLVTMAGLDAYVTFLILAENNDPDDDSLSKTIQSALQERYCHTATASTSTSTSTSTTSHVSFVFLDHCKTKYLSDLQQLEASQIIRAQTSVAADNVIFHGLDEYRDHLQQYASRGIVETRLEMGHLEYVATAATGAGGAAADNDNVFLPGTTTVTSRALPGNKQRKLQTNADFRDGLELTYYLKDPC
jgi:predicted O-methyltransferase YrrM